MEPTPEELAKEFILKMLPQYKSTIPLRGKSGKVVASTIATFYRDLVEELRKQA